MRVGRGVDGHKGKKKGRQVAGIGRTKGAERRGLEKVQGHCYQWWESLVGFCQTLGFQSPLMGEGGWSLAVL